MNKRSTWCFYFEDTGEFNGVQFTGPEIMLSANTPAGLRAIEGVFDSKVQRVDLKTLDVVARVPEAPPATELHTWEWQAALRHHVPVLTLEGRRVDLLQRISVKIREAEGSTDRALRDLILSGPPGPSRDRLQLIEEQVQPLRDAIEAARVAESMAELTTIDLQVFLPAP